jgi:ankyrin repeat protein
VPGNNPCFVLGFTPLHLAVIQGNLSVVNLLLANNADVNALDNEGHSVVHWATGKFLITYNLLITLTD